MSQYADDWPFCNGYYEGECYADSSAHNWDYDLGQVTLTGTYDTLYNSWDTLDLTITLNNAGNNNFHEDYVDVYYENAQVEDNDWAITGCIYTIPYQADKCDHFHVKYDPEKMLTIAGNAPKVKSIACHETGHTVGLTHEPRDGGEDMDEDDWHCMHSDENYPTTVGGHNGGHVNFYYS